MAYELPSPKRVEQYKYGLISSLGSKELPPRIVPEEGATFIQESCEDLDAFDLTTCPPVPATKPPANRQIRGIEDPPLIPSGLYLSLQCSSVANSQDEANEAVRAVFERQLEFSISKAFRLQLAADPDLVAQGAATPSCALALGQGLHSALLGRGVVIFAPSQVVSVWTEGHAVFERDGKLFTSLGNLVVITPAIDNIVYFSDSYPDVYISPVRYLEDEVLWRLRTTNDFVGVAEASYLIAHDPCALLSYDVNLGC